jgi:Tfp pilus assembly protein PilW
MSERNRMRARAGFSLIEVVLALALTTGLLLAVTMTTRTASDAYEEGRVQDELTTRAHRTLERIAMEFASAGGDVLDPEPVLPMGATTMEYRQSQGYAGGEVQWGPVRSVGLQLAEGELDDGIDNNGNGLVDESSVVLTRDLGGADERSVVLCNGVPELLEGEEQNGADDNGNGLQDEEGLSFELQGNVLVVRLTLEKVTEEGRRVARTVQTSVRMRN